MSSRSASTTSASFSGSAGAQFWQLQRDLERLQRSGLVVGRAYGNRMYYRAGPSIRRTQICAPWS